MPMPTHLRESQDRALRHRRAATTATREVKAALGRAALADVRSVTSTISGDRVLITVQAARWHDVPMVVVELQDRVPGLVDLTVTDRVIRAYRQIEE